MKNIKALQALSFLGISILLISPAFGQGMAETVVDAIAKMETQELVTFTGKAEVPAVRNAGPLDGPRIIAGRRGQKPTMYEDPLEISFSPADKSLLICSQDSLPGIAIFQQGDDLIKRITFQGKPSSVDDLANDLVQLSI